MSFTTSTRSLTSLLPVVFACLLLLPSAQLLAAPSIVASIKPLQLIAGAITHGVTEPGLILRNTMDPHEIVLRPSDRRMMATADVVLWIGPSLELPLAGLVNALDARILTAQQLPDIRLYMLGDSVDPHLWLSLHNAGVIARALAASLTSLDPLQGQIYAQNLASFEAALARTQTQAAEILARSPVLAWGVYHHAFQYLERELALPAPLAITDSNNNTPGIRGLLNIRQQLQAASLACLLAEPGTDPVKVRSMLDMPALRIREVDIMGNSRSVSPDGYLQLFSEVLDAVSNCSEGVQHD